MAKILRTTDRIKLQFEEVVFYLSPLTYEQKLELTKVSTNDSGNQIVNTLEHQKTYIKYSLKDIEGVTDYNDEKYILEFEGDKLTDKCVDELFNIDHRRVLASASYGLLNGFNDELIDLSTGEKLEGVTLEVVPSGKS